MDPRDAANRDLLIGLFALQTGMVDQDALIAAFRTWTRDKSRPIAEILAAQGAIDADDRSALEALVAKHVKRHGDDVGKSLAAVPTPRSVVNGLAGLGDPDVDATLGHVGSKSHPTERDPGGGAGETLSLGSATSDGRRFRVLRPHARGGLGVVLVALDNELHREVALKQILDHHADDPTSRTRFVLEAEITGGLEHPGIVPVYGLGAYDDGRPYYAMRFIRGDSLKEAVERFHAEGLLRKDPSRHAVELRKLLRRFLDVCNAVDYAHSRGVLHRDLKPANVIVGKHGETLVVDWGLAKSVDRPDPGDPTGERVLRPSSSGTADGTLPGTALGTPAYMSPEQAGGALDRLGPPSDVYSLGATLYFLLTGKAAFEGDVAGVLRAVQDGTFPPPRKVDPTVDRALEAVCLKAMARGPGDRYPTPRALADDLERWVADEPVTAYPEPWPTRARRWARRNRTAVVATAAAVVLAAAGLAAVAVIQTRASRQLEAALARETAAREAETAARNSAQARYDTARQAVESFYTGASEDVILKRPDLRALRERLLRNALTFYNRLLTDLETSAGSGTASPNAMGIRDLAKAAQRVAEIQWQVGAKDEALEALLRAEAIYRKAGPLAASWTDMSQLWLQIGRLQARMGRPLDNFRSIEKALTLTPPLDPGNEMSLIHGHFAHKNLGMALLDIGRPGPGRRTMEECLPYYEARRKRLGGVAQSWTDLASHYQWLGYTCREGGDAESALAYHRKQLEGQSVYKPIGNRFVEGDPPAILAQCHLDIGLDLTDLGRYDEARRSLEEAHARLTALLAETPSDNWRRSELARTEYGLARLASRLGPAGAGAFEAHASRALGLLKEMEALDPYDRYRRGVLFALRAGRAGPADREPRVAEAVAAMREAVDAGFLKAHLLATDPDLAPLRERPDFLALRRRVEETLKAVPPG